MQNIQDIYVNIQLVDGYHRLYVSLKHAERELPIAKVIRTFDTIEECIQEASETLICLRSQLLSGEEI